MVQVPVDLQVELMVQVPVDLLGLPVSLEQPSQDSHPFNPHSFLRRPGVLCSFSLAKTSVTTFPPSLIILTYTRPGMDSDGFLDDQTVLDQLPDVLTGVGVSDLVDLVGIKPNLVLTTFHNPGRQAFL